MKYQYNNGFLYHSYFIIINHILFFSGLYWYGVGTYQISVLFASYFISLLGEEIGLHRYYTHRSFKTSKIKENIIFVLAILTSLGPIIWFVGTHRLHHRQADTTKDPHSPRFANPFYIWICRWNKYKIPYSVIKDICKDKKQIFATRYYHFIWMFIWMFGLLVAPCFTCFFCGGICMVYHIIMAVNVFGHLSDKDKTYPDIPGSNNKQLVFLTAGAANHNIHHKYPKQYDQNIDGKFDLVGIIIKKFLKVE